MKLDIKRFSIDLFSILEWKIRNLINGEPNITEVEMVPKCKYHLVSRKFMLLDYSIVRLIDFKIEESEIQNKFYQNWIFAFLSILIYCKPLNESSYKNLPGFQCGNLYR